MVIREFGETIRGDQEGFETRRRARQKTIRLRLLCK